MRGDILVLDFRVAMSIVLPRTVPIRGDPLELYALDLAH